MEAGSAVGTAVLVHGGFVDGSGWQGVYERLTKDGYTVSVVQNPTLSHADDVAVTRRAIDAQSEPVVLVGHSYGGAVITEAGNHPKVAALVFIAAFACSLAGMVWVGASVIQEATAERFADGFPGRAFAIVSTSLSALLVVMWTQRIATGLAGDLESAGLYGETTMVVPRLTIAGSW